MENQRSQKIPLDDARGSSFRVEDVMKVDFNKLIDAAHEANQQQGTTVQGGKKYSTVATRVELFRRNFGADCGIETDVLQVGVRQGEPVLVKATIRDTGGFVIATGHAQETVGQGNVNRTSALENAETSAVGRALASLGIHGGEMASLNEIEAVGRKEGTFAGAGLKQSWEDSIFDALPEEPSEQTVAEAYVDTMRNEIEQYKTVNGINGYITKRKKPLAFVEQHLPEAFSALKSHIQSQREQLTEKAA